MLNSGFLTPVQEWCSNVRSQGVPLTPLQEAALLSLEGGSNSQLLMEAAASGDFPELMRNTMYKTALKSYVEFPQTWRNIVSEVSNLKDFRANYRTRMSEAEDLEEVKEYGEYRDSDLLDEDLNFRLYKFGRRFSVSWETLVNDDTGKIKKQSERFGKRAAKHLDQAVWTMVTNHTTNIYDGTALFTTAHANMLGTAVTKTNALNEQNLINAFAAFRQQTDMRGEQIDIVPRFLAVSPMQEPLAWKLLKGNFMPLIPDIAQDSLGGQNPNKYVSLQPGAAGTTTAGAANQPNFFQGRLTPLIVPWLGNGEWYLIGDPKMHDTIEVGFLNGKQEPEILIQDGVYGTAFSHDKIQYRVKMVYGKVILDYKTFYKGSDAW